MKKLIDDIKNDAVANGFHSCSIYSILKLLIFHPGFQVLFSHRLQVMLLKFGLIGKLLSKILWRFQVMTSSCYISSSASLEGGIHFPHATGIVIGEKCYIGKNSTIYQNVTLGRRDVKEALYPKIGKGVVISAGAQVLGPIAIGDNSIIGANAVVINNVPANKVAVGIPARIIDRR